MIRELAQGIDGLVTIAMVLPWQAVRTFASISPGDRKALLARLPMGDDMRDNYYFGNPQIFKMPKKFRRSSPGFGAFEEGSVSKALPYIAVGIAGIVAYNILKKK
jgi:hypothetical protein